MLSRRLRAATLLVALVLGLSGPATPAAQSPSAPAPPRRIAVFGSSVAFGTGDDLQREGYTGRLRELLMPAGWAVLNQSRGGDNTQTALTRWTPIGAPDPQVRYLLPVQPSYVVLGLSLGNEGIRAAQGTAAKDATFQKFESGLRAFVDRSRAAHIVPIVTLCYTRNDFTEVEYAYTRRMNLAINAWDVPSVNFLGAVDDGTGRWASGFWNDALHPNSSGHTELALTFVPTLFEALEQGRPTPTRDRAPGFARLNGAARAPLTFTPSHPMHPFTLAVHARAATDGRVARVQGVALEAVTRPNDAPARNGGTPTRRDFTTLTPGAAVEAGLAVRGGVWTYLASNGTVVASTVRADAGWHDLVVTHYTARGESLFYVDGRLAGRVAERLEPQRLEFGGSAGGDALRRLDLKDVLIYRSALTEEEVAALAAGTLLQASLEVYAPLTDARFAAGRPVANRAQSLSAITVTADGGVQPQAR